MSSSLTLILILVSVESVERYLGAIEVNLNANIDGRERKNPFEISIFNYLPNTSITIYGDVSRKEKQIDSITAYTVDVVKEIRNWDCDHAPQQELPYVVCFLISDFIIEITVEK